MSQTFLAFPPWAQMWMLAIAIYAASKWLTWRQAMASTTPAWQHCAYLIAWPGMDAAAFLQQRTPARQSSCGSKEWSLASTKIVAGMLLLFGLPRLIPPEHEYAVGLIGMAAFVVIVHFGVFHFLSCSWRGAGLTARLVMDRPITSASVGEFWGKRWNTAFRDLTHHCLFRPLARRFGWRSGLAVGFLFSGLIHDIVISLPARGGYGGPTVYFAMQGLAILIERSEAGRRLGLGSGWRGRCFAAAVLVMPVGLLFHRPFVLGILVPFMHAIGAL